MKKKKEKRTKNEIMEITEVNHEITGIHCMIRVLKKYLVMALSVKLLSESKILFQNGLGIQVLVSQNQQ